MESLAASLAERSKVLVVTHRQADLDAVGSAVGLAATLDGTVEIAIPGSVDDDAEPLLAGQPVVSNPDLAAYDLVVVVDAPSSDRVAPYDPIAADTPFVLVDHHERDDLSEAATTACVDTDAPATALLVARALSAGDWTLTETAAMALAAGILDDAGPLRALAGDGYEVTTALLEAAGSKRTALVDLVSASPAWSERMATAKALVRARGYKAGETIVLTTRVGGEERAGLHALLGGNADVALVVSPRGDRTRLYGRVGGALELSLPGDVLEPLVDAFGGESGGHAGAAGAKLDTDDPDAVEREALARIEDALGTQFGEFA